MDLNFDRLETGTVTRPIMSFGCCPPADKPVLSPERTGIFTASQIHRLMTNGRKKSEMGKTAKTYIEEKACESLTGQCIETPCTAAMQWGIDHELEAISRVYAEFAVDEILHTGTDQGFFMSDCGFYGGTPDGIMKRGNDLFGVEVKCPNSLTHLRYRSIDSGYALKKLCPDYYWQIQCLISLMAVDVYCFASYDPRFKNYKHQLHTALISRNNSDISNMLDRIETATEIKERIVESGRI